MVSGSSRTFVRVARGKTKKTQSVEIRVTNMSARDALWWDVRLGPHHAGITGRADRLWSWSALLPACHLVQLSKRRYCRPLVIWARADNNQFVRVGMSIFIEQYPHLDVGMPGDAHFVWFMSAADPNVLVREFQMSDPPALARVFLDNAIVLSLGAGLGGRIGLHAAGAGGPNLFAVYVKCGLSNLPAAAMLPKSIRRKNDGRFFYADDRTAQILAEMRDPDR